MVVVVVVVVVRERGGKKRSSFFSFGERLSLPSAARPNDAFDFVFASATRARSAFLSLVGPHAA